MPQIGPNLWKVALSFFWWRQYRDGTIEQEFDPLTGQIRPWGRYALAKPTGYWDYGPDGWKLHIESAGGAPSLTPPNLARAGWQPVSLDLARKMATCGEYGTPTQAQAVLIDIKPGEELEIFKEPQVLDGYIVRCKPCGHEFFSFGRPQVCPACGATIAYRCPKCSKLSDEKTCPDCSLPGAFISPFQKAPAKQESVTYFLGIKGLFRHKFNSTQLLTEH